MQDVFYGTDYQDLEKVSVLCIIYNDGCAIILAVKRWSA